MEDEFSNELEIWKNHIASAESDPGGIGGYCREHGLRSSAYYSWRQVIKNSQTGADIHLPRPPKKEKPTFYPVEIAEAPSADQNFNSKLPDARWVAEVMLRLLRGLP